MLRKAKYYQIVDNVFVKGETIATADEIYRKTEIGDSYELIAIKCYGKWFVKLGETL